MSELIKQCDFGPRLEVAARSIAAARPKAVDENQDNYLLIDANGSAVSAQDQKEVGAQVPGWPAGRVRLAVLDGVGGHGNGRQVAEAVTQGLIGIPACQTLESLAGALEALHYRIQVQYRDTKPRPGATLVLVEIPATGPALLFSAGDSRLYRVTPEEAQWLTVDHVPATHYAMSGALGPDDWEQQVHGEDRSEISQAFVLGNTFERSGQLLEGLYELSAERLPEFLRHLPDRRVMELERDCIYLLATDGLWAFREPREWVRRWPKILCYPDTRLDYLLDDLFTELILSAADEPSVDNATAIAFRLRGPA